MSAWLQVSFHEYWHLGAGRGGGPGIDATVRRTPAGLPFVPGRTLKGVLRDAADQAVSLGWIEDRVVEWFGTGLDASGEGDAATRELEQARFRTQPGCLRVDSARMGERGQAEVWERAVVAEPGLTLAFFDELHQTAMEGGVAQRGSLRTVEVAVPMTLWARLDGPDSVWPELRRCLPLVAGIGSGKRRGLGRVELMLHAEGGR